MNPKTRNKFASDVRLLQVDFAVRDTRSPTGWVFGTFMYNGNKTDSNVRMFIQDISEAQLTRYRSHGIALLQLGSYGEMIRHSTRLHMMPVKYQ